MGELLRRRGLILASDEDAPLYSFLDRDFTIAAAADGAPRSYLKVGNGNRFNYLSGRRGSSFQAYVNLSTTAVSNSISSWPTIFEVHAGDTVLFRLKDIYLYCNASSSYAGYVNVALRNQSNSALTGFYGSTSDTSNPLYIEGGSHKSIEVLEKTVEVSNDYSLAAISFYGNGTTQTIKVGVNCSVEIYVNGVRYI